MVIYGQPEVREKEHDVLILKLSLNELFDFRENPLDIAFVRPYKITIRVYGCNKKLR
jgi:hypothetical protein